jgi:hypothetical protein
MDRQALMVLVFLLYAPGNCQTLEAGSVQLRIRLMDITFCSHFSKEFYASEM